MRNRIVVKGARRHNPTFAEAQRRYVESLSACARQFPGQLDKPDVDAVEGLSPTGRFLNPLLEPR